MKMHTGKAASAAYTPDPGHTAVVYTHTFKPEHFREGARILTEEMPVAQTKHSNQSRHNIFLQNPTTHQVVNISFFDKNHPHNHHDWHESPYRLAVKEKLERLLVKPIDIQVFHVRGVVGISDENI